MAIAYFFRRSATALRWRGASREGWPAALRQSPLRPLPPPFPAPSPTPPPEGLLPSDGLGLLRCRGRGGARRRRTPGRGGVRGCPRGVRAATLLPPPAPNTWTLLGCKPRAVQAAGSSREPSRPPEAHRPPGPSRRRGARAGSDSIDRAPCAPAAARPRRARPRAPPPAPRPSDRVDRVGDSPLAGAEGPATGWTPRPRQSTPRSSTSPRPGRSLCREGPGAHTLDMGAVERLLRSRLGLGRGPEGYGHGADNGKDNLKVVYEVRPRWRRRPHRCCGHCVACCGGESYGGAGAEAED